MLRILYHEVHLLENTLTFKYVLYCGRNVGMTTCQMIMVLTNGRYLCWIPYWNLDHLICWNIEGNFIRLYFSKCDLSTVNVYSLEHYFSICHFGLHFPWKERVNMKWTSYNLDCSDDWTVFSYKKITVYIYIYIYIYIYDVVLWAVA